MSITIKEIATLAGVSRGTVDRALNGRGGVSKEVEKRILEIAETKGYKPNLAAKSLALKSQKLTIGVIMYSIGNEFFDDVLDGIYTAANEIKEFAVNVIIKELEGYKIEEQISAIDEFLNMGVNAIAITPLNAKVLRDKLDSIKNIPIIALNVNIEGKHNIDYIGCDYYKSGQTAGAMMGLYAKGKGNILVVTGNKNVYGHARRTKGFVDVITNENKNINIVDIVENFDSNEIAYDLIKNLLKIHPEIDGIFFGAGGADGGINAILEANLDQKLTIIANDVTKTRIEFLKQDVINAIICQQPFEQGYNTIKRLFDCIMNNETTSGEKIYTIIGIKLKYNFD